MQSLSSELGESYEELSLLYKLSCSMTLDQPPARFLIEACRDLQQVVGLRWMALQLNDDPRFNALRGNLFTAGDSTADNQTLNRIGLRLLEHEPQILASLMFESAADIRIPALRQLATHGLIVPLMFEGQRLGILFGGDKIDRTPITSVDTKLVDSLANSLAIFLQNTILYEDMEAMFMGTLKALTSSIDAKDSYTLGHTERVAMLARHLAMAMDLDASVAERVYLSGLLHDVGKIGVPESVLTKPGALTAEEFEQIKMHPEIGARILRDIRPMQDLVDGVLYHHERWDGRGYPHKLAGENIPLFGRILCLADSFDAMSSNRTYRDALPHAQVLAQIDECRGTQFDPTLAQVFVTLNFQPYFQMAEKHKVQSQKQCA
jgi:putative nucleotidyltransferase with HDIG domain